MPAPSILVIGLSHRTAPVDVREKFAAGAEVLPEVLARLSARPELREVMFLSTCNRVEVFAAPSGDGTAAARAVREAFAAHVGQRAADVEEYLYERVGDEALRHIFRVAASLDSMVLGEPQILGQVKEAYEAAVGAGALGNFLGRAVSRAFTVAKRVRSETQIGAGQVSISSVAVDLAKKIFGDLSKHSVLLVGAGEMAEAAAKALGKSAHAIRVCNRSFERAAALAQEVGGAAAPWTALEDELYVSDVVVTSTASQSFVITRDLIKRVMRARKHQTLFFVDIAVPRNVEPDVHKIDNVYVYNIDDLEQIVGDSLKSRQGEALAAEAIVEKELADFTAWARGLDVQPTVVALRAKTKAIMQSELEKSLSGRLKHLTEGDRAALLQMLESAVNKLLHAPTTRLKASAASDASADLVEAVKHLFDLPEHEPKAEQAAGGSDKAHSDAHSDNGADKDEDERLPH
jgi:glutamyl-tRNA reductase